jgi:Lrp/AsnC family transcriptional regulator, leucine-responsive regulatory protein
VVAAGDEACKGADESSSTRHRRPVDALDAEILRQVRADARLSMAELGRRVGLSRTATLARVRRLEDAGVIRGYHADVAEGVVEPTHAARVGIVLRTSDVAAYVRRLQAVPELEEAESVAGEFDLVIRVAARSAERLDELLDRINGWRETVRTTTYVVLRDYR